MYAVASLHPIVRIGDYDSITTLNAGATWRAKGPSTISPDVDAAFTTFANELRLSPGTSPTDGTTPLSKAYYAFWTAHKNTNSRLRQRVA